METIKIQDPDAEFAAYISISDVRVVIDQEWGLAGYSLAEARELAKAIDIAITELEAK